MACRYEKERLKEKKIQKNIQNIKKSQEDMITSKTNPKDIKNIKKRKISSIRPKSTPTIIKRESSQGGETHNNPLS